MEAAAAAAGDAADADDVMEDIAEQYQIQEELQEAVSQPVGGEIADDDDLLAELEELFPEVFNNARLFTVVRDPWTRLLSSYRNPDPDLVAYYRWRTHSDLNQLSLAEYIDVARWLPHPHLRPQLDALVQQSSATQPDPRIRIFRQEQLHELEQWLSAQCNQKIRLNQHNPARRPLPDLQASDLQALEQQVRWLYAMDAHAFGYTKPNSALWS